jgi:hypothetical protein
MTEPTEPTTPTYHGRIRGPDPLKPIAILVATLVVLIGAAVALGASPASTAPGASASPEASSDAGAEGDDWDLDAWKPGHGNAFGHLFGRGRFGIHHLGGTSISAISGSEVSLETVNGWRRTITVTDDVMITKAGEEIELADLAVGDRVALREVREDDGSFRVTHLVVLLPTAAGIVTAIDDSSITIRGFDGETATIHVDAETTYRVAGQEDASLEDIEVGMAVAAQGTERADGSLDADHVKAGDVWRGLGRDRMKFPRLPGPWAPEPPSEPDASAEMSVG